MGLVGCAARQPAGPTALQYDLGPLPPQAGLGAGAPLLEISMRAGVPVLASSAMLFRLIYVQAQQVQPYALARWSQPPLVLVAQQVRHRMARRFAVLTPGEVLPSPGAPAQPASAAQGQPDPALPRTQPLRRVLGLRLTLEEFSQVFETRERSSGLVRVRATLVQRDDRGGDVLLAQHTLAVQQPAPSADAAGGVVALAAATTQLVQELDDWVAQVQSHTAS
ncbi:MAG: hypothetical protein Fur007_23480 [Rhodoferax sp.]